MLLWHKCFVNGTFSELNNEQGFGFVGELKPAGSHNIVQNNKICGKGKELARICMYSSCLTPKAEIYLFDLTVASN